ncbi:hypothetical protein [Candidatus Lokiarchaeum ossiferum]|uniref:hypothetical protein n=1 Tax=Candidatus Lokiarchaeum ossiferum TaxID=2951803 RepID=UPI00352D2055
MVKILSLIGGLLTAAGAVLFFNFTSILMAGEASIQEFFESASINSFGMVAIAQIVVYLGMILVFISGFIKTNKMLVVSGIFGILASLGCLATFIMVDPSNTAYVYGPPYWLCTILYVIAALLNFIGCIGLRKKNKLALITALLLFLGSIVSHIYFGFIAGMMAGGITESFVIGHMLSIVGLYAIFFIHSFVFFFTKKKSWLQGDGGSMDDAYSVSGGSAFASYVPEDDAYALGGSSGKKKKKKKKGGDDFDFNF